MSGCVANARYIRELINCTYPCSIFGSSFIDASLASFTSSLTLGSIGVDTGFAFTSLYLSSRKSMYVDWDNEMESSPMFIFILSSSFNFLSDLTLKWTFKSCSMSLFKFSFVDAERKPLTHTTRMEKLFPNDLM